MSRRIPLHRQFAHGATLLGSAMFGFFASSGAALGPPTVFFDNFEHGLWEIRARNEENVIALCIDDGRKLIQIRHQRESCRHRVVEEASAMVTVHYTCPGNGYGHTTIRFENARLAQIETQGIEKGLPFNFAAEGRRVGNCPR